MENYLRVQHDELWKFVSLSIKLPLKNLTQCRVNVELEAEHGSKHATMGLSLDVKRAVAFSRSILTEGSTTWTLPSLLATSCTGTPLIWTHYTGTLQPQWLPLLGIGYRRNLEIKLWPETTPPSKPSSSRVSLESSGRSMPSGKE